LVSSISTGEPSGLPTSTTAADIWPDGQRLLIRGYLRTFELSLGETGMDAAATAVPSQIVTGLDPQGEAIAYDPSGPSIWHISEGINPALWVIPCAER